MQCWENETICSQQIDKTDLYSEFWIIKNDKNLLKNLFCFLLIQIKE